MAQTLYSIPRAGGLAACQVGVLKRLVVIDMGEGLLELVNPEIIEQHETQHCIEGCLRVPDRYGVTTRPQRVTVRALNRWGEPITLCGENDLAKCFCHEIDHLTANSIWNWWKNG